LAHEQLTFVCPPEPSLLQNQQTESVEEPVKPTLISYEDFLVKLYPDNSDKVTEMRAAFAKPGGPGQKFKVHLDKLNKVLSLPKGAREELGISGEEGLVYDDEDEER
jgi:hypothetical protein